MNLFLNGATWLRADFHLHTKADREFIYSEDEDYYCSNYVNALANANVRVGIITNHNKFNFEEFKALRKTAKSQDIFLLPGVELSVNEGRNGVHALVVFSDEWLENGNDRISTFITSMFPEKAATEYQNENGLSDKNILQTVEELDKTGRDYFLIFAHVEDAKGLWKESKLHNWGEPRYHAVTKRTLGFQQVRTRDERDKVKQWLGALYPAEVEGSNPKSIDQIGQKSPCYIKLGAYTFEAVKFALLDHENRLRLDGAQNYTHSHIKQISFEGGALAGHTIRFSPELNALIGIRGSGKSSVLEALRYVLEIPIDEKDSEREYKQKLVERALGSGGKIVLDVINSHGQQYQIRRIWKENANVFIDGKLQPGVSIRETVLTKPLFFGQKELAAAGKGSEKDLIEKLLYSKCDEIRRQIAEQKSKVTDAIDRMSKVNYTSELIEEQARIKLDAEHRLDFYKKHNLEEKLQKRLGFETDIRKAEEGIALIEEFIADVRDLLAKHEDELRNFPGYSSTENADFFKKFDDCFSKAVQSIDSIKAELLKSEVILSSLKKEQEILVSARNSLSDEFAAIERSLAEVLKTQDGQNISTDEFIASKKKLAAAETALAALTRISNQKAAFQNELNEELQKLNDLWHNEFQIVNAELEEVTNRNAALQFSVEFKEDKSSFLDFFQNIFRGSGAREATYRDVVEKYRDFIGIYRDFENAKKIFGSNSEKFADMFKHNLKTLLTYQTPNKFTIAYRGKELAHHSLGQRASALILFVLGQEENDVVIIDQPEDDLDNQTIYDEIIKLIRLRKPSVQFIFATHNPNIPVLGDAEQIHGCSFADGRIDIESGGLDEPMQQKKIIDIMEGGKEAFERRKGIYQAWKS